MPKRLAVSIAGAVSLGSYEAGALFEIIQALETHNAVAAEADRIVIDVLTGASAGGMTAAIAAHKLLYDAPALRGAQNHLYLPWVADVDIVPLLALAAGEPVDFSLLSSDFIETLSRRYLTARYEAATPPAQPHPAAAAGIRLGVALSNLNGVDYRLPVFPAGWFTYTRSQDDLRESFLGAPDDSGAKWERVRAAAVASGAFPFAFRVQELTRAAQEYPGATRVPFETEELRFAYTDGGVFQNEPLGLAKNLVDLVDDHQDEDSRFYLFIAPAARGSGVNREFAAGGADFRQFGARLAVAVIEQAQFHDWILVDKVNARVSVFEDIASHLCEALRSGVVPQAALDAVVRPLLARMYPAASPALTLARQRLALQYAERVRQLNEPPRAGAGDSWIDALVVIEAGAGIQHNETMRIYAATARPQELAGAGLQSFMGFMDRAYRQHDYDLGRRRARELILAINDQRDPLGPIGYAAAAEPVDVDPGLAGLTVSDIPIEKRVQLKSTLKSRIEAALAAEHVERAVRIGVDWLVLDRVLNRILEL